jgi:hypothetical protein
MVVCCYFHWQARRSHWKLSLWLMHRSRPHHQHLRYTHYPLVQPSSFQDRIFCLTSENLRLRNWKSKKSTSLCPLHALSSSATVFLSGQDILSYLRKLETEELKVQTSVQLIVALPHVSTRDHRLLWQLHDSPIPVWPSFCSVYPSCARLSICNLRSLTLGFD